MSSWLYSCKAKLGTMHIRASLSRNWFSRSSQAPSSHALLGALSATIFISSTIGRFRSHVADCFDVEAEDSPRGEFTIHT